MADVTIKVPKGFSVAITRDKSDRDKVYNLKVNKSTTVDIQVGEPPVIPPIVIPPPVVTPPPTNTIEADWIARSTATGVCRKTDFRTDAEVLPNRHVGGMTEAGLARITRYTGDFITGGSCLKIATPADAADSNGQAWYGYLNDTWTKDSDGFDTTKFYVQYRMKIPASRLIPPPNPAPDVKPGGWKFAIIANKSYSDPIGAPATSSNGISHVHQDSWYRGWPQTYAHSNTNPNGAPFETEFVPNNGDINLMPGFDRGPQYTNYLDRYCCYTDRRGCPSWPVDEWVTIQSEIQVKTYGGKTGNSYDFKMARQGATEWTMLTSVRDYEVGSKEAPFTNGFNGIWLTPYETGRNKPGEDTYILYDQLIVSTQPIALPKDLPMIAGGAVPSFPSWRPAAGNIVDISNNKMNGVGAASGVMTNSGSIFAEHLGLDGTLVHTGGGHGDSRDNALYGYDISTGVWSLLSTAHSGFFVDGSGYVADHTNGEYWVDGTFTTTHEDQPASMHAYKTGVYLPPGYGGAGAKGAYLSTVRSALPDSGSINGVRSHIFDFATPGWARFSTNTVTSFGIDYGPACLFKSKNAVYKVSAGTVTGIAKLNLTTKAWANVNTSGASSGDIAGNYPSTLFACEALNLLGFVRPLTPYFRVINVDTGVVYAPGTTGSAPTGDGSGVWIESLGKLIYHDSGSSTFYTLTPSASPTVDPWVWTSTAVTGTVNSNSDTASDGRLHWSAKARALIELDYHNTNVQGIVLAGM